MSENKHRVIIIAADSNYLTHAKSLMVNCVRHGGWTGDIALISPPGTDVEEFGRRGIVTVESDVPGPQHQKYTVFSQVFQKWDEALYLDCDILVQGDLQGLFAELEHADLIADREMFSLFHCFTYWAQQDTFNNAPDGIYDWLWSTYDPLYRQFNTGVLLFRTSVIPEDAVKKLIEMRDKIAPINIHVVNGTDQPVFNLVFYDRFTKVRDNLVSYWETCSPESIVLHYCSGYAPWIDKKRGMDAYLNEKLGRPCNDIYVENLSAFEETFPCIP